MAITTAAGDGLRVTTAAKNGTLGSQAGAASNQIILDTTFTAVNNGNVSSFIIGRLVILRRGTATEETKKVIAGTVGATTLTVHEDWTVVPASGDTYHISYALEDLILLTGATLSAKTGVYELTRRLNVGTAGGGAFAYFAIRDQQAMEIADTGGPASLVVDPGSRMDIGYTFGGVPVNGGIINVLQNTLGENAIAFNSGSTVRWYDPTIISYRALMPWSCTGSAGVTGNILLNQAKVINFGQVIDFQATGSYQNITWATSLTSGSVLGVQFSNASTVDTWTLVGPWITSTGSGRTETITVRNMTWVGPISYNIFVEQSKSWAIVNPTWSVVTSSHRSIGWFGTGNRGEVLEKYSFDITTVSASGTPISGSSIYIYEGLTNRNLPNSGSTNSSGSFSADIQTRRFTSGSTTLLVTQSGDFALKVYRYGFTGFAGGITVSEPIDTQTTLTVDNNLSTFDIASALAAGSSSIRPIKHGPGQTDALPLRVFHYISGSGVIPTAGQKVSGTLSTASGSVLEVVYGDNTDAYLVLSGWNGRQFYENETIGNGSAWSAKTDLSASAAAFNQPYTWEYNCANYALQTVYDYDRALITQLPPVLSSSYRDCIIWGEEEQLYFFDTDGTTFFTPRNQNLQQGVWLSNRGGGTIGYMTSDSGSLFTPPTTVTFELTGLKSDSEVRIYNAATDAEITGIESVAGTTFSYSYIYSGSPITAYVVIFHLNWKDIRLTGITLADTDQSIPIQQQTDRVYSNPT